METYIMQYKQLAETSSFCTVVVSFPSTDTYTSRTRHRDYTSFKPFDLHLGSFGSVCAGDRFRRGKSWAYHFVFGIFLQDFDAVLFVGFGDVHMTIWTWLSLWQNSKRLVLVRTVVRVPNGKAEQWCSRPNIRTWRYDYHSLCCWICPNHIWFRNVSLHPVINNLPWWRKLMVLIDW